MVDSLVRTEVDLVHGLVDPVLFGPLDVPVELVVGFFPASAFETLEDAVLEGGPEPGR